jgi:hypothetical protein
MRNSFAVDRYLNSALVDIIAVFEHKLCQRVHTDANQTSDFSETFFKALGAEVDGYALVKSDQFHITPAVLFLSHVRTCWDLRRIIVNDPRDHQRTISLKCLKLGVNASR